MILMSFIQKFTNQKISSLGIIKIVIIILAGIYLIGNFFPFYLGIDAYLYGIGAIDAVHGSYEYTNEFLQNAEDIEFSFGPFIKTIHGTLIPHGAIGIYGLASFSYLLGGYYSLFYLGPISTILFLIISERVTTKLFGSFVGFAALTFLFADAMILHIGRQLLTDSIFSLLLILGIFFLIKFLKQKNNVSILLCSGFLAAATFFRYNGVIFLPIEILIIVAYFMFHYIKIKKEDVGFNSPFNLNLLKLLCKIDIKKIFKTSLYILGPWSVFFIFLFSFNNYFFGEPFTTYWEQKTNIETENVISSYLIFDLERFESIKQYSAKFLPDQTHFLVSTISFHSVLLDQLLISIISISLLFSAILISFYFKIKRKEVIVFIIFILGLLLFYSSGPVVSRTGITQRYMFSALPLSFGIIGYLMYIGWKINYQKITSKHYKIISKSWKGFLIIIFTIFLLSSFYYSKPIDSLIIKHNFDFKNPQIFADRYPLDQENLKEKSIILHGLDSLLIWEYDAIPFNPFIGYDGSIQSWKNIKPNPHPIKLMNELLDDEYDLYVFKEKNRGDPTYYRYLEAEHGLILKEHSETFCKLIRIENVTATINIQIKSDDICHKFFP